MLQVGRWVVAAIGAVEAGYFGLFAFSALLYAFAGFLAGALVAAAALAALALAGAAGTLGRRRWGGILVTAVSGLPFTYLAFVGSSVAWIFGLATILALGYTVASWRALPSLP